MARQARPPSGRPSSPFSHARPGRGVAATAGQPGSRSKWAPSWHPPCSVARSCRASSLCHRGPDGPRSSSGGRAVPNRAVILSGSLGSGHDVICEVVTGSLAGLGWESRTLDCMGMLGRYQGPAGDWVFRRLMGMPGLYDALHFAHLRPGSRLARAMDRSATARLVPALQDELRREPAELIVAAFATGASAAAKLSGTVPGLRTVALCADAVPHSAWVREGIDLFLVTSPAAAAWVYRYVPHAAVCVVPPPVRPAFYRPLSQADARQALGLPADARCALLMGGGWGLGPLEDATRALADAGVHVLAVAGNNRQLA